MGKKKSPSLIRGAELLQSWRSNAGFSQVKAAALLGVRQASWSEWERGLSRTPGRDLAILLEVLTGGAVQIESWSHDRAVANAMAALVRMRYTAMRSAARSK